MLRIAVPNKGSLSEPASQMLVEAGYRQRSDSRELVLLDDENETEFFFLRPRDIAVYVGSTSRIARSTRSLISPNSTTCLTRSTISRAHSCIGRCLSRPPAIRTIGS